MKFKQAAALLDNVPHISRHSARILYDFLLSEKPTDCLELGFAHGASSGYIAAAAALHEAGEEAEGLAPDLDRSGLYKFLVG